MVTKMSIGQKIVAQLATGEASSITVNSLHGRLLVRTTDADRLGVLLQSVRIDRVQGKLSADELRQRLQCLSKQVDYLSEKLALVEHDPERTGALMRSETPRRTANDTEYFELRVEKDRTVVFHRYRQKAAKKQRRPVDGRNLRKTWRREVAQIRIGGRRLTSQTRRPSKISRLRDWILDS